jgi:hypothetical protein
MEKPLIFSTPMVRAILEGRKTVTRRIIKPQPKAPLWCAISHEHEGRSCWMEEGADQLAKDFHWFKSFEIGDILWVRETFEHGCMGGFIYKADHDDQELSESCLTWKPSIYMPRAAARIFLKIKAIKVERLQNITFQDIKREGFKEGESFNRLWDKINGQGSFDSNPWVWVIEFERVKNSTSLDAI